MPRPRSSRISPGWVPGSNSSFSSLSRVGIVTEAPGAAAGTCGARDRDRKRHVALYPQGCLEELDLDVGRQVSSSSSPGAGATAHAEDVVAEERREEIAQAAEVELGRAKAAAAQACV